MFSRLPESNAPRQRRTGGLVLSTAAHAALIALAVRATMLTATPAPKVTPWPIFIAPLAPRDATPANSAPRRGATGDSPMPTPPQVPAPPAIPIFDSPIIPEPGTSPDVMRRGVFDSTSRVSGTDPGRGTPKVAEGAPMEDRFVDKVVIALPGTER